jgi:hypothetical protein
MTDNQFAAEVQNKAAQIALLAVQVDLQAILSSHHPQGKYSEGRIDGLNMAIRAVQQHLHRLGLSRLENPATGQPEGKDGIVEAKP